MRNQTVQYMREQLEFVMDHVEHLSAVEVRQYYYKYLIKISNKFK